MNTGLDIAVILKTATAFDEASYDTDQQNHPAFSLIFEGAQEDFLAQGMYKFSHSELGEFDLFIVPIGPEHGKNQMRYEAIFN